MAAPELAQLEMLAQVDELIHRLTAWSEAESSWEPMQHCRALIRRLLQRVEQLRIRLESPLVVATFGGTGTGKSTMVNALVGRECTESGRQRPTTKRPVLIAHPHTQLELLGLPLEEFEVVTTEAPILRDIIIVDCPDPDTSETDSPGSNLERLRQLLPHCDVLIYTSTQQKYRSARVLDELHQAAEGCRLIFVQTHADLDEDIRDDWRNNLGDYEVPDMFFIDSQRALREQAAGQRPTGDFSRLQDLLTTQLAASQRVQVRRANLVDLILAALQRCQSILGEYEPELAELQQALQEQREQLTGQMSTTISSELQQNRNLWERRLLSSVTQHWGISPFSSVLRIYNGLGSFIASFSFFRARTSVQMALIGVMEGSRLLQGKREEQAAEDRLGQLHEVGLTDASLQEAQFVMTGYVKSARLDPGLVNEQSLAALREEASRMGGRFLGDAGQKVDGIINKLAVENTHWLIRWRYEFLFLVYLAFVLFRVGKNFFYDTFLNQFFSSEPVVREKLLTVDFYIPAALFFFIWAGLLAILYTQKLSRSLRKKVDELAADLATYRLSQGLFPELEEACRQIKSRSLRLQSMTEMTEQVRNQIATAPGLGRQLSLT